MSLRPYTLIRNFVADQSGQFALLFGAAALVGIVAVGLSVDLTRAYSNHAEMRDGLDAAVLATSRAITSGDIKPEDAEEYLEQYLEGILGISIGAGQEYQFAKLKIDQKTQTVSAILTRDVPLAFMSAAGIKSKRVSSESTALFGFSRAEIAMTFDVTGSMAGSKISDLRNAAEQGIKDLLAGNVFGNDLIKIAVVPYAEGVNAGPLAYTAFVEDEKTNGPPPKDTDPIAAATPPDLCTTERKGAGQFKDDNPSKGRINRDFRLDTCPAAPLVPLTTDFSVLKNTVDDLFAAGGTAGHVGIQWAWYLLSPKWADYMPAISIPAAYSAETRKFAIIMTDGEFNVAYAGVDKKNSQFGQAKKSMQYARKLCDNMKKQGIEVFTIGFALKEKDAKSVMKDCASPDTPQMTYYYETNSGDELKDAYADIAYRIKKLRLVR